MSKNNDQLLLDYKKSNKERRQKIVSKAGFKTEIDYINFLLNDAVPSLETTDSDMLDQVIAFDTTGSMGGYIAAVKQHVKELIPKLFAENPSLRLKIVAFGDYCDMSSPTLFGNAYQVCELTDNQNELINFVNRAQTTSGGDSDEFYEVVLKKVVEETSWRQGSRRALLLIGDYGPHPVGYTYGNIVRNSQIDWKQEAGKAVGIGLQIDTLNCGNVAVESFYKPLSYMTDGVNIPFSSQSKTTDAVYAVTSVRGSSASKMAFMASETAAMASGDEELIGTYKSLRKKL